MATYPAPTFQYNAVITNIHDGDTITVGVDCGFRINYTTSIRFNGINAPELDTPAGVTALTFLQTLIKVGDPLIIKTYKDPEDKYGRWLADLYRPIDTISLNQQMIDSGNAAVYHGEGPKVS